MTLFLLPICVYPMTFQILYNNKGLFSQENNPLNAN